MNLSLPCMFEILGVHNMLDNFYSPILIDIGYLIFPLFCILHLTMK